MRKKVKKNPVDDIKQDLEAIGALMRLNLKKKKIKETPREESKILYGRRCPKCQEVIVSLHVHDFRRCGCRALAIDGGQEYCRLIGNVDLDKLEVVQVRLSTGYST